MGEIKLSPFDATEVTPQNFEGFYSVLPKQIGGISYVLRLNFPEGFIIRERPRGKVILHGSAGEYLLINSDGSRGVIGEQALKERYKVLSLYNAARSLNTSEAIMAFASWLTTRKKPVTFSRKHSAATAAELVSSFCKVNKLPEIREGFTNFVTFPEEE